MSLPDDDLVGINEIAELAKVSRQAVANWRARFPDFPKPVAELRAGPVFRARQIQSWLRRRKIPMARVISLINLKGGVAKTTIVRHIRNGSVRPFPAALELERTTDEHLRH